MENHNSRHNSRGGQPRNQNARKHGFYAKEMVPEQIESLDQALKIKDLTQEIALLRVKLATIVGTPGTPPELVLKAIRMLSHMIEIQHRFNRGH